MEVTLYSTDCPKCKVLGAKLDGKNINYNVVSDINVIIAKGINAVPVLEVDNNLMDFKTAVDWVNAR